jgi:hypothetical protein
MTAILVVYSDLLNYYSDTNKKKKKEKRTRNFEIVSFMIIQFWSQGHQDFEKRRSNSIVKKLCWSVTDRQTRVFSVNCAYHKLQCCICNNRREEPEPKHRNVILEWH